MEKIILVDWGGYFNKVVISSDNIDEKYYLGDTINGVKKYKWNFLMWIRSKEL